MITLNAVVHPEDIKNARSYDYNGGSCPIALAISRHDGITDVNVSSMTVDLKYYGDAYTVDLPQEAIDFVSDFDEGESVYPFNFDFDL